MAAVDTKQKINQTIRSFSQGNLTENALKLFQALGYNTELNAPLTKPTYPEFKDAFVGSKKFREDKARTSEWKYVDLLFQLSKDQVTKQNSLFDTKKVDRTIIESYLFFTIELKKDQYSRTELSLITREVNRLFPMPVMILFKYNSLLTLSIINRRLHKRDESKDVLEKVTQIKDIHLANPHRAHIEILFDLSFDELYRLHTFSNFVELHNAWQKTLDTKELNKRFFQELANWYFWAIQKVTFPDDVEKNKEIRNATSVIRLITRLIFVWFLKEKRLISDDLFDEKQLKNIIKYTDPNKSTYYKAILQNLFFATLNTEMEKRRFRTKNDNGRDAHYFIHNVFRYEKKFINPKQTLEKYFDPIPFLNGGLFECLDKEVDEKGKLKRIRIDGFSDRDDNILKIPDELFFCSKEKEIDLNEVYGTRNRRYQVHGVIDILNRYKFTVAENTPIEEEVALDPELLGKVFENLLANFNPETKTTARKQTGSFYTPREIVNYMVDESLLAYLKNTLLADPSSYVFLGDKQTDLYGNKARKSQLVLQEKLHSSRWKDKESELEAALRQLIGYDESPHSFSDQEVVILIHAIDSIKILDPACGSGAFPMGILHKLVHILHKLDPNNSFWKQLQLEKAEAIDDPDARKGAVQTIEEAFANNELDYGRKLYLIENCIYGVDIQPIAVQIAKLRFFISLIVDQRENPQRDNRGIRPLPNLETKFVAANSLIRLEKEEANLFTNPQIDKKKEQLRKVRHSYFEARTPKRKENCRNKDKQLRDELTELLVDQHNFQPETAKKVAAWNPYDQNASASFFDMEWMFGFKDGFDIVIGNPPYKVETRTEQVSYKGYSTIKCGELYAYFFEISIKQFLKKEGTVSFITASLYIKGLKFDSLRRYLERNLRLISLHVQGDNVFENVQMPTAVLIGVRSSNECVSWTFDDFNPNNNIIKKIERNARPLSQISDVLRGFEIGRDMATSSGEIRFITGSDVSKWAIKKYSFISRRIASQFGKNEEFFRGERILVRETGSELTVLFLNTKLYCNRSLYSIKVRDKLYSAKFLASLMNSSLFQFYYQAKYKSDTDLFPKIRIVQVGQLPIRLSEDQNRFEQIVDKILASKATDPESDTKKYEQVIDLMVYKLYDMTYDEVKIIDPTFTMSEVEYKRFKID